MLLFTSLYFSEPSGSNRFFLSSLLLSHRSKMSAVIHFFIFFFSLSLWRCLPRISLTVSVTAVLKVEKNHWIYVRIFIAHDGERCKPPAYHISEGFQNVGIFQLFEVKLEACVFWLADFFQVKAEGHHHKSWSLPVSAPGKLCVLAMFTPDRKRFLTRI